MAPRRTVRLALAALAVVAVASCSGDDPEPVATAGGLEMASTTTEQPRITQPSTTTRPAATTTSTSTTTTTTTPATTTTTRPVAPTADELSAALPQAAALPGGPWDRSTAPTELGGDPGPLCAGSTVATPLSGVVDRVSIAGGVSAQYDRADGRTTVQLVVAPLRDVSGRLAEAATQVATCPGLAVVAWPTLGDGSLAYARAATTDVDGTTWAVAHEGEVVVGLTVRVAPADGVEASPPPTDAALQAFLQASIDGLPDPAAAPTG